MPLLFLSFCLPTGAASVPANKGCLTQPYLGEPVANAGTAGIIPPRPRGPHTATYPELARRASIEGSVVVSYVINEDGVVTDVRLKRSSGFPILDSAACAAVWAYQYAPATRDGVITPVRAEVMLKFQLRDQQRRSLRPLWFLLGVVLVSFLLAIGVAAYSLLRNRVVAPKRVKVSQIPEVVRQLQVGNVESSFVVFTFDPRGGVPNADTAVNLQYSVSQGRVGLDWALVASANIADKDDIAEFIEKNHHQAAEKETNGVRYLRVEGEGVAALGMQIVNEFYHLDINTDLNLIMEGFQLRLA